MESLSPIGRYYIAFVDWEERAYVLPGEIHRDNLPGESVVREGQKEGGSECPIQREGHWDSLPHPITCSVSIFSYLFMLSLLLATERKITCM